MDRFIIRSSNQSVSTSACSSSSTTKPTQKHRDESEEGNTPKKMKFCDKIYDKTARMRKFQPNWKITYPWVEHAPDKDELKPGEMFCSTCRKYPEITDRSSSLFIGCSNMRIDALKKHETSSAHIKCTEKKNKDNMTPVERSTSISGSPIVKATKKSSKENMNSFKVKFNTVYALAKKGKPISDYETHMELHAKNRSDIGPMYMDIGSNYLTEKSAKQFLISIGEKLRQDSASHLENCRFLTVIADGSTDCAMIEQYTVMVRFVKNGSPITKLASIEAVESACAKGILKGIESGLSKVGVTAEKMKQLVSVNFDGAAVMMGCKSGVSTLMRNENTHIVPVHCVAHKLELGVLDAVKRVDYLTKFEETVKGIYRFYANSPKRRRDLVSIANMLETDLIKYGDVKSVRWVASKGKALKAIEHNLPATMGHLEHAASVNKVEEGGKAKKILQEVKSARFVKYLYFMMDYLEAITATSVKFQKNNMLIMDVPATIQDLTDELELMQDEPGKHSQMFYQNYDDSTNEFQHSGQDIKLAGHKQHPYSEDTDKERLLTSSINYLMERFSDFQKVPLKYFKVFDISTWPADEKELLKYGRMEVKGLCDHYSDILGEDEKNSMLREWTTLKNQLKKKKAGVNCRTLYSELLQTQPDDIKNILVLANIMMTISPSTAECERQFSAMKLIKSSRRSHMKQDTLESLMRIHADGPPTMTFDPEPAIHHWMTCGPGTRHLGGHKLPDKLVTVDATDTEVSTSAADDSRDQ